MNDVTVMKIVMDWSLWHNESAGVVDLAFMNERTWHGQQYQLL